MDIQKFLWCIDAKSFWYISVNGIAFWKTFLPISIVVALITYIPIIKYEKYFSPTVFVIVSYLNDSYSGWVKIESA